MRQVFFAALVCALAGLSSGCKLGDGLGWNAPGDCGPAGCGPAGCQDGACGGPDGHSNPYEPLYQGNGGAPHRSGLISQAHCNAQMRAAMAAQGAGAGGMGGTPPQSAGAVAYPYYTTRGPRDFLAPNPRGIGP